MFLVLALHLTPWNLFMLSSGRPSNQLGIQAIRLQTLALEPKICIYICCSLCCLLFQRVEEHAKALRTSYRQFSHDVYTLILRYREKARSIHSTRSMFIFNHFFKGPRGAFLYYFRLITSKNQLKSAFSVCHSIITENI